MSNRVFQSTVFQMKDAVDRVFGVVEETGEIVACSDPGRIDERIPGFSAEKAPVGELFTADGYTFKLFTSARKNDFAVFVGGEDEMAGRYASLIAAALQSVKLYYDEKQDRANFIKNVVLDNILPGDIYAKAREMHFTTDAVRAVFLIRVVEGADVSAFDVVQRLFPDRQKDFVFSISETDIVLVKEIRKGVDAEDLAQLARSITETLSAEHFVKSLVGIGTQVESLKDLAESFKEAQVALEVGKIFDTEHPVVRYDNLGIARLVYQLPNTLCDMYLREVFKQGSIDSLDSETLFTIQRFFENNLNVSETSRGLFVHRNTLVYRLEKIKKLTGLDLREFDDAIVFKVALMVKKYLNSHPMK